MGLGSFLKDQLGSAHVEDVAAYQNVVQSAAGASGDERTKLNRQMRAQGDRLPKHIVNAVNKEVGHHG